MYESDSADLIEPAVLLRVPAGNDGEMLMRLEALISGHLRGGRTLSTEMARSLAHLIQRGREAAIRASWPQAQCLVIDHGGIVAGRMWVDMTDNCWQLIDVALLPTLRGRGLAAAALRSWLRQADAAGARVHSCTSAGEPFILRLRFEGFTVEDKRRGQVWLKRAKMRAAASAWTEPTQQLAA